jgi:hypothetical protein
MFRAYERALAARPILVKTVLGGSVACLGDYVAQTIEQKQSVDSSSSGSGSSSGSSSSSGSGSGSGSSSSRAKPLGYDPARGFALTSLGLIWNGPLMHAYFSWLERTFPQRTFGSAGALRSLLSKTAMNQLVTNPFVYLPLFYTYTGFMYGRSMEETFDKAQREYWASLRCTWLIFTPLNFCNFYFTPVRHQVTVNVLASFVFNTALSLIAAPRQTDAELSHLSRRKSKASQRSQPGAT